MPESHPSDFAATHPDDADAIEYLLVVEKPEGWVYYGPFASPEAAAGTMAKLPSGLHCYISELQEPVD